MAKWDGEDRREFCRECKDGLNKQIKAVYWILGSFISVGLFVASVSFTTARASNADAKTNEGRYQMLIEKVNNIQEDVKDLVHAVNGQSKNSILNRMVRIETQLEEHRKNGE